jgi:hypothetical protein
VLHRMRLPYVRAPAPEVLATAKAQRWDPAEVLRVLLFEEVRGRDAATQRMRRKAAGFPTLGFTRWSQLVGDDLGWDRREGVGVGLVMRSSRSSSGICGRPA